MTINSEQAQALGGAVAEMDEGIEQLSPLERLEVLGTLEWAVGVRMRKAAEQARSQGATWEVIGRALGVSRQAAQQKYGQ